MFKYSTNSRIENVLEERRQRAGFNKRVIILLIYALDRLDKN